MADDRTPHDHQTLRILDAAANRAREGLRVVEDFVRFALDDGHITRQVKQLRHDLTSVLLRLPTTDLIASRDTTGDVGTGISTAAEASRANPSDVAAASFKRLQEALRTLEEFSKVIDPALGGAFEQIRYRGYTLERAVVIVMDSIARLTDARLYVLIDGRESRAAFSRLAGELIAAGVDVLQLRDKTLSDRDLLDRARDLAELTRDTRTLFIMNDRPDLAVLSGADGVHVGQDELRTRDVRRIVGPRLLIGVSTHAIDQAREAEVGGANYLGLGPTFASGTKTFAEFSGVAFLRQAAAEIRLPAFAIGGITPVNCAEVFAAGIERIAVGGAILNADDPVSIVRALRERMRE